MKIRKLICILLCAAAVYSAAGCGDNESSNSRFSGGQGSVKDVLEQGMAGTDMAEDTESMAAADSDEPTDSTEAMTEEDLKESVEALAKAAPKITMEAQDTAGSGKSTDGIDVDLASMSSTMVYAEVYNMMCYPEDYVGKTVRMKGVYARYYDETTDKHYHSCIISDATACCSQGIEFELTDEYSFPDDYPEVDGDVCVTGVFDIYTEDDYKFCTLRNAHLEA